jgi:hypothetical protein
MVMKRLGYALVVAALAVSCTSAGPQHTASRSSQPIPPPQAQLVVKAKLESFNEDEHFLLLLLDQHGDVVLRQSFPVNNTTVRARTMVAPGPYELVWDTAACPSNECSDVAATVDPASGPKGPCRTPLVLEADDSITAVVTNPFPGQESEGGCLLRIA